MKLRNLNHISELLKIENREAEMFTPWGPVVGSFQHTLWPLRRASEAAILLSLAFAFVISWYRVIIAPSLCSGALQYTVYTSITGGQDSLSKIFISSSNISVRTWGSLEKNSNTNTVGAKCKLQTADRVRNADCALGTKCTLRFHTVFFVWYVITCQLTTYRASRNRFSTIIFHDYLHCCAIFLARFLITIVHNITSNLHIVFSLCARVGWCDVCREVTNLMAFGILFILLTKMWTETKIFSST